MRSRVSMVIRLPSRSRCTSLPSLTARRPKVDSAISTWRQNSVIWLRIWSFFIRLDWEMGVGSGDCADVLPSSAQRGNAHRLSSEMRFGKPGNALGFETDLPELTGRRGDLPAKIETGLPRRPACQKRHPVLVEDTLHVRHQLAQVGPKARRKNDRVEFYGLVVAKHDGIGSQAIDSAAYLDGAVPDSVEGADIDQRHPSTLLDQLQRSLGRKPQPQFVDPTKGEAQYRGIDPVDQSGRQILIEDGPGHDRKTQQIAWQDLHRTAHRKRDVDAGFREVQGDLTAGIAESDNQHALSRIRLRIAIFTAVDDRTPIEFDAGPGGTIRRIGQARRNDRDRCGYRASGCLRDPSS